MNETGHLDDHLLKHLRPLVSLNWLSQQTVSDSGFSGLPDIGEPGPYYMGDYSGGVFSTLIQPADGLEKCTGDLYGPFNYLRSEETGRAHAFRSWRDANGPIVIVFTGIDLAFSLFHLRHRAEALLDKRWVPEERLRMVHPDVYRERCLAFVREVRESSQANGESRPIWLTGYGPAGMLAQQLGLELSDWVGETPEPGLRVISFNSPGLDVAPEGRQDHITSIVTDKWLFHVTGRHHPGACYYWGTAHGCKLGGSHLIGAYGIETPAIDGNSGKFLAGGDLQNLFELMSMLDLWLLLGHDAFVEAFAGYTLGELMAIAKGELTVEGGELGDHVRRDWPIYCDRLWHDPWYHGLGSLLEDAAKLGLSFHSWKSHLERLPNSGVPALTEGVPLVEEVGPPEAAEGELSRDAREQVEVGSPQGDETGSVAKAPTGGGADSAWGIVEASQSPHAEQPTVVEQDEGTDAEAVELALLSGKSGLLPKDDVSGQWLFVTRKRYGMRGGTVTAWGGLDLCLLTLSETAWWPLLAVNLVFLLIAGLVWRGRKVNPVVYGGNPSRVDIAADGASNSLSVKRQLLSAYQRCDLAAIQGLFGQLDEALTDEDWCWMFERSLQAADVALYHDTVQRLPEAVSKRLLDDGGITNLCQKAGSHLYRGEMIEKLRNPMSDVHSLYGFYADPLNQAALRQAHPLAHAWRSSSKPAVFYLDGKPVYLQPGLSEGQYQLCDALTDACLAEYDGTRCLVGAHFPDQNGWWHHLQPGLVAAGELIAQVLEGRSELIHNDLQERCSGKSTGLTSSCF